MKEKKKGVDASLLILLLKTVEIPLDSASKILKYNINKWFINVPTPSYLVFPRAFFAPSPEPEGKELNDYLI